jgi:hypothetical protein
VSDGASLATLLDASMYFGLALGRVGSDVRALLVVPFERRLLALVTRLLRLPTAYDASCDRALS